MTWFKLPLQPHEHTLDTPNLSLKTLTPSIYTPAIETFFLSKNLLRTEENLLRKKVLSHPLWLTPSNSLRQIYPSPIFSSLLAQRAPGLKNIAISRGNIDEKSGFGLGAKKINANVFGTKFFNNPSGHGRPCRKSWTSSPRSAFSCGPGGGEKLFDLWAFGRKGQACPREIRAKKFMFMLFFLP